MQQIESKSDAARAYVEAANCHKKYSIQGFIHF